MIRALLLSLLAQDPGLRTAGETGLRVAPGFRITMVSGPDLANDLYAMTLDAKGRPVVTSQGWIRTLHDDDGDGRADRASTFAPTATGAMGMCFDGNDLLFCGDGHVSRYRDADGDGQADGPPEKLFKLAFGEHGGHAIRKGPDGWFYIIGGNDAGIGAAHVTLETSPVRRPEAGAIIRATPDFSKLEIVAHGFRNPYDFDFNAAGDLFTYDSDCERDFFLPWYTPTRLYHVGIGMHHGWRLKGHQRSFARRDYDEDTVDVLWPVGRGSPTGVTVYRHTAFPERYRGGVFYADWTFGRIWFTPLVPEGASYKPQAEVFLEPSGSDGFAPTDLCVTPDGALLVSIGGRRTRGAVYRIEAEKPGPAPESATDLDRVLRAPQPLDAWSRAGWESPAGVLGHRPFRQACLDPKRPLAERVRAVEILTDLFPSRLDWSEADLPREPELRARIAWSLGTPAPGGAALLKTLAADPDPRVRRCALEAGRAGPTSANLRDPDRRVRQAAAHLASRLPDDEVWRQTGNGRTLAALWRNCPPSEVLPEIIADLGRGKDPLRSVRLAVLALGDWNLHGAPVEVQTAYSLPERPDEETRQTLLKALRPMLPSSDARLGLEVSRLLAMLEDDAPETLARVAAQLTEKSDPTSDVHHLIVISRLRAAWPDGLAARVAHALLSLNRKLEGREQRTKQSWGARLAELARLFAARDPLFAAELVKHPAFAQPAHVDLAPAGDDAARLFLAAVKRDAGFGWTEPLIALISRLPAEEVHPVLRAEWSNFALRDSLVLRLSSRPDPEDRDKFLAGVESAHAPAALASLGALETLPRDETPARLVPLLRLLRRLTLEPKQAELRRRVTALVARQSGRSFEVREEADLRAAYRPVFEAFPALRAELEGGEDPAALKEFLKTVPWERGDAARGAEVFRARGCQTCHAVQGALGPNLAGAAARFSRDDLFEAIANPGKDVAPLYRTTLLRMKDGTVHSGIVAFESADGYIVQTGATTTVRVNTPEIAGMRPGSGSIMPNDLLKGLKPEELADLYAHLRSLGR